MIDFERKMNTLTTHTDDINLQIKTDSLYAPLFVAVSTAEKQYFRVELENGLIKVSTNMNKASNPPRDAVSSFNFYFDSQMDCLPWNNVFCSLGIRSSKSST